MSFGLQTFDASGRVQIDTTRSGDSGMIVIDAGTASSVSNVPSSARVFVNVQPSSGNVAFVAHAYSGSTVTFYGTATPESGPLESPVVFSFLLFLCKACSIQACSCMHQDSFLIVFQYTYRS